MNEMDDLDEFGATADQRLVRSQFGEMLIWLGRGWKPVAAGHRCGHCQGPLWSKTEARVERFRCVYCGIGRDVVVK